MEFERENPPCKFSIPDRPTVRQQLEFFSLIAGTQDKDRLFRYWTGAQALITEWECELLPDRKKVLDDVDDSNITDVIVWAGISIVNYMNSLDSWGKNS